ncbi:hypothetical protein GMRT_15261 [Giardia muris]|uniref:Uncharacterized protein n=1 Tax=Giardia muris TaxID=5742 RepID=A0A4Z1ST56_GIAMU|nr:hypothetical protein GMRT_15261 [Giardia muris]|eukprot:TNJ28185.1 hypothetical protein GMRT_15261 [Giardia muris]
MEATFSLRAISELPTLRSGGLPCYFVTAHICGCDGALLPEDLSVANLKPVSLGPGEVPLPDTTCLSLSEGTTLHLTLEPEQILASLSLYNPVEAPRFWLSAHPATIDTICTRLVNSYVALDLLAVLPASQTPFSAPKKAAPSKGAQPEDSEFVVIPVASARLDVTDQILNALSVGKPIKGSHVGQFHIIPSHLGPLAEQFVVPATGLIVEFCLELELIVADFIQRYTVQKHESDLKSFIVGSIELNSADFGERFRLPGTCWNMDLALPVEASSEGAITSAIYFSYSGAYFDAQPAPPTTKKDATELTADQVMSQFRACIASIVPQSLVKESSEPRSRGSGVFPSGVSTGRTELGSRYSVSGHNTTVNDTQSTGGLFRINENLAEIAMSRNLAAAPASDTQLKFPEFTTDYFAESLEDHATYVETILNVYQNTLKHRMSAPGEPSGTSSGEPRRRGSTTQLQIGNTSSGTSAPSLPAVRFPSELFEPFLLQSRYLVKCSTFFIVINSVTQSLIRRCFVEMGNGEFLLSVLLRPRFSLQQRYILAEQLLPLEKKPPVAPMAPIASAHSAFSGNAQGLSAFCSSGIKFFGVNRSTLFYTQSPDQIYSRLPQLCPTLQQAQPVFLEPLAYYCFTQIDIRALLNPLCQFASCDALGSFLPFDPLIFQSFFPSVVSTWRGLEQAPSQDVSVVEDEQDNSLQSPVSEDQTRSRPASAAHEQVQLRGKAGRQGTTTQGTAGKQPAQVKGQGMGDPVLLDFVAKAARYESGAANYILGNVLCGAYVILEMISRSVAGRLESQGKDVPPIPCVVPCPGLNSRYVSELIEKYCGHSAELGETISFLRQLQQLLVMPASFNSTLRANLVMPSLGGTLTFRFPLLAYASAAVCSDGSREVTVGDRGTDSSWPSSLRLANLEIISRSQTSFVLGSEEPGTDGEHARTIHPLAYFDYGSASREKQKTMMMITGVIKDWRQDIIARYKQLAKGLKADVTDAEAGAVEYSSIPEENQKMKAIMTAGRQLSLRGLQGQLIIQNALVTPKVLPQISQVINEERTEIRTEYSFRDFKLLLQNEGFVELISRKILSHLETLAHKGFNDLSDMLEFLLLNIVEQRDNGQQDSRQVYRNKKLAHRIDKDDEDEELDFDPNGMETLLLPRHVALQDIRRYLFRAKFLTLLGMETTLEHGFQLAASALARHAQLLTNDRKIDIFLPENIIQLSRLVESRYIRIMSSTLIISGLKIGAPHHIEASTDFDRIAQYMRGPAGVVCSLIDQDATDLIGTDAYLLTLAIMQTVFKNSTGGSHSKKSNSMDSIVIPYGRDYSELLFTHALLMYENFMCYLVGQTAVMNNDSQHEWAKNDTQQAILQRLNQGVFNKSDIASILENLRIKPQHNHYLRQFNDLLEGELSTATSKLNKQKSQLEIESCAASVVGSVAGSVFTRTRDTSEAVGGPVKRLTGNAFNIGPKPLTQEQEREISEIPMHNVLGDGSFTYPPFWCMGAYIYIAWSMRLMDAGTIVRGIKNACEHFIIKKHEAYKMRQVNTARSHGNARPESDERNDKLDEADQISDLASGTSSDITVSVDSDLTGPSGPSESRNHTSGSHIARLSLLDLRNFKQLKRSKSQYTQHVSLNHLHAIQAYLRDSYLEGSIFSPNVARYATTKDYMEMLLDVSLPENDRFQSTGDPVTKQILRLCAFISLAEWLTLRGETLMAGYTLTHCEKLSKEILGMDPNQQTSAFFNHQQLRIVIANMRKLFIEKKISVLIEYSENIMKGSLGSALVGRAKTSPAFLFYRARALTNLNYSLLSQIVDKKGSSHLVAFSMRTVFGEIARIAIQAYQLASHSRQVRDDFFRGSTSIYESYLPAEFLYILTLILLASIRVIDVIRSTYRPPVQLETQPSEDHPHIDLIFTGANTPKRDSESHTIEGNLETLLQLPEANYLDGPLAFETSSVSTSAHINYLREQYKAKRLMAQKADAIESHLSVGNFRTLKRQVKDQIGDAEPIIRVGSDGTTDLATRDTHDRLEGVPAGSTGESGFTNTMAALANATLGARTLTPEKVQKDIGRALILASSAVKNLLQACPHLGEAWALFSISQLAMGNVAESRLSSSISTLLAPESPDPWISWICCELQEGFSITSSGGHLTDDKVQEIRSCIRQIDAMGIGLTFLNAFWTDVTEFSEEVLS